MMHPRAFPIRRRHHENGAALLADGGFASAAPASPKAMAPRAVKDKVVGIAPNMNRGWVVLLAGCLSGFALGWIAAGGRSAFAAAAARGGIKGRARGPDGSGGDEGAPFDAPGPSRRAPYAPLPLSAVIARRPDWRTDYELSDWLPRWLPRGAIERWESRRTDETHRRALMEGDERDRDEYFWRTLVDPAEGWKAGGGPSSSTFAYALADNGFGHRLVTLAFSYMCNVVPNRRQQLVFWHAPGLDRNVVWHRLFEDTPVLTGVPPHWELSKRFEIVNSHRRDKGMSKEQSSDPDCSNGDYSGHYPFHCAGRRCEAFDATRETWLLRLAREPSAQEFFMLLRAQLRKHIKEQIASFIEDKFPKDKLVVGVHVRSGNGKDDKQGHFDLVRRGEWMTDLPAAVAMVRKHARMVAHSLIDRYNRGASDGIDFDKDEYDEGIDGKFRIFLATDSPSVLEEFRRQDPHVLFLPQERMPAGEGVPINDPLRCENRTGIECSAHADEAMFMDAMIMSSCDAALATSYSNWMYSIPAALRMAEGRVFCESGRAALGGKYTLGDEAEKDNIHGLKDWWIHPPANVMPVRCYQGAWAARDRSNLHIVQDVP